MAAVAAPLIPRLAAPSFPSVSRWATFYTTRYTLRMLPSLSIALPGISLNIPGLLGDIWEGILRAVPKNKTSHSRKRHRQMAGKALKDVNNLCRCPGCGAIKRTHRLCQHCLEGLFPSEALWLAFADIHFLPDMRRIWREDSNTPPVA